MPLLTPQVPLSIMSVENGSDHHHRLLVTPPPPPLLPHHHHHHHHHRDSGEDEGPSDQASDRSEGQSIFWLILFDQVYLMMFQTTVS